MPNVVDGAGRGSSGPRPLLLSILALGVSPAGAAKFKAVSGQRPVTSPEARAQLQRILEQNAPLLEAQATVVKTVAKLIGPTVVHIEADVPQQTLSTIATGISRKPARE